MKRDRENDPAIVNPGVKSSITGEELTQTYFSLLLKRVQLPVYSFKETIQQSVLNNPITLLTGETGSGKTTQVPHFIAEMPNVKGMVVCTQPRRVAAMSVAKRVALEVGATLGNHVGYNVRFDNKTSSSTRLAYYTDGMLLREFVHDADINRVGVVIVDEAHERTVDSDLLLGLLKDLVKRRTSLRVVVMSATLDMDTFQRYFQNAPLISVPGRMFPVDVHFSQTSIPFDTIQLSKSCAAKAVRIHIDLSTHEGDILVFLPGESEIVKTITLIENAVADVIRDSAEKGSCAKVLSARVLPLFGSLPLEEQSRVFEPTPPGTRKIVCSTNIAETSLTIDGIVYVIDSCYHKQSLYNPKTRVDYLLPTLVSKASAQQRMGRAGRTRHGVCHRMITAEQYAQLPDQSFPEVMRCEATSTILMILRLGYENPFAFPFISPPPRENFLDGYMRLSYLGALHSDGGAITDAGRKFVDFPTSPSAAKAILKGASSGCSVDVAIIIAMLEVGNIFKNTHRDFESIDAQRASLVHVCGDHLTLFNIFHAFVANSQSADWCREFHLNHKALQQAANILRQLLSLMERAHVTRSSTYNKLDKSFDEKSIRRALFEGYFLHTALCFPYDAIPYLTVAGQQRFTLHPSSVLNKTRPQWIMYHSLEMQGGTPFARIATRVDSEWFKETCEDFFDWTEIEGLHEGMKRELEALHPKQ